MPKPIAHSDNAILMEYLGDEDEAAPTLSEVRLQPERKTSGGPPFCCCTKYDCTIAW